jgi:hypothetical protein
MAVRQQPVPFSDQTAGKYLRKERRGSGWHGSEQRTRTRAADEPEGGAGQPAGDERYDLCPAGRHWRPRGAVGILPWTVTPDGRTWVLLSHLSPHV